ncbi:MAG: rhodanese-like domain-containing protein [Lentisphaeria bacterium]|nr:rhodanese-like domain-containing protein [Lentisphaeria bacterium]
MQKLIRFICCAATLVISGCTGKTEPAAIEKDAILLDVRTAAEYQQKHIKGAVNLPLDKIDADAVKFIPAKNTPVYIYCRSGRRSKNAMGKLLRSGYLKVTDLGSMSDAEKYLKNSNFPL